MDGEDRNDLPYGTEDTVPVYKEFEGWKTPLGDIRSFDELPEAFKTYVRFIETETGCPIRIISVGPDRGAVIRR